MRKKSCINCNTQLSIKESIEKRDRERVWSKITKPLDSKISIENSYGETTIEIPSTKVNWFLLLFAAVVNIMSWRDFLNGNISDSDFLTWLSFLPGIIILFVASYISYGVLTITFKNELVIFRRSVFNIVITRKRKLNTLDIMKIEEGSSNEIINKPRR